MELSRNSLIARFGRFSVVGVIGYVIDAAIVSWLIHVALDPFTARIISMGTATAVTWRLNRSFTFRPSGTSQASEGTRYAMIAIIAALVNYSVFALLVLSSLHVMPAIAVALATGVSMWVSYFGYGHVAFGKATERYRGQLAKEPYSGVEELHILADAHNYNRALTRFIKTPLKPGDRALDFGAGIGSFSAPLTDKAGELVCLEPDSHLNATLRRNGYTAVSTASEIADESIDYAFTLNVLEHIEDDEAAMRDLHRMLKPGATLAVYVPAIAWLYTDMDRKVGHWRRYGRRELISKLEAAGFQIERARFADSLGVLATLAYKLVSNGSGDVSKRSVDLYDRIVFPLSHAIDRLTGGLIGKNLAVYATRL